MLDTMETAYIVKALSVDPPVYLFDYVGLTRAAVQSKIFFKALDEKFTGTVDERLKELNWEIVKVTLTEIPDENT